MSVCRCVQADQIVHIREAIPIMEGTISMPFAKWASNCIDLKNRVTFPNLAAMLNTKKYLCFKWDDMVDMFRSKPV